MLILKVFAFWVVVGTSLCGISREKTVFFACPHHCGAFGSESIQEIEEGFIELINRVSDISDFFSNWSITITNHASSLNHFGCTGKCHREDPCTYCIATHRYEQDTTCYFWGVRCTTNPEGVIFSRKELDEEDNSVDWDLYNESWCTYSLGIYDRRHLASEMHYRFDHRVDLLQALSDLEDQVIWLREEIAIIDKYPDTNKFRPRSERCVKSFQNDCRQLKKEYQAIFTQCAQRHNSPSAFYQLALDYFEQGDYSRGLEQIEEVFSRVDFHSLESHLASELCLSKGSVQSEIALYDEALLFLKEAIEYDNENKQAYFDTALTLLEQGRFQESEEAFQKSEFSLDSLDPLTLEFSIGLTKGLLEGAGYGIVHFIPSLCSSIYGISHGIWAFVNSPEEVSKEMAETAKAIYDFLKSHSALESLQEVIPELKEFAKTSPGQNKEQGEIVGTIIGKYGVEILALFGTGKAIKLMNNFKRVNATLTLKALSDFKKAEKLEAISKQWWKNAARTIEDLKLSGGRIGTELYTAFGKQPLSELQVRRILHQAGFRTFPRPEGIPKNAITEISKKGGGMVYRKPGSTQKENILVRVMPGNPKSINPLQQKAYVIQRRGDKAISKNGTLVEKNAEKAHIPIEEFKFVGW